MVSLATAGTRFNSLMKTVDGVPFSGSVEQMTEGQLPSYDFSEPRLILRVNFGAPVSAGVMIFDTINRRYLLARMDTSFSRNEAEYTTYRMFFMNALVEWNRPTSTVDPLTKQPRSGARSPMGNIYVLMERVEREFQDATLRAKEETRRVISNADLKLNDLLNGFQVKRVDKVWGVTLAEVQ